ncbi:MAG: phosphopantothenoylcysteine decarboxylase [Fimbriiglobus sp.]
MNILVTAGNTQAPLDRVRCVTNIFTGKTGARIAARAWDRGHAVTLLTSHPAALADVPAGRPRVGPGWAVRPYHTFADLDALLADLVPGNGFDALIHAAAVSDFLVAGVYAPDAGTRFDGATLPRLTDATAGKVPSSHAELWVRMTPAPKLVDRVRRDWNFLGKLVKFKLEVGRTDAELLAIAERSRVQSGADLMSANTLEGMQEWAFVGAGDRYRRVSRDELPDAIVDGIESVEARGLPSPGL